MQTFYIGNYLRGDELAIAQQLISVILTCFVADVLDASGAEAPHRSAPLFVADVLDASGGRGAP